MIFGLRFDFSLTAVEARRQWNNIYNILRGNPYLSRIVTYKKYFKHESEKRSFQATKKMEFPTTSCTSDKKKMISGMKLLN